MTQKIMETRNYAELKEMLKSMNVVDIAEELEEMKEQEATRVFRMMPKDTAADVFAYLSGDMQQQIVSSIKDHEIKSIINDLFLDDAVDFIEEMPANVVTRVLNSVSKDRRDMINQFLKYPEDSAGSIMTIEFVDLKKNLTVKETFAHIREKGVNKETIYTCYVIDKERHLLGTVSVRTLLLAEPEDILEDIMDRLIIFATTDEDKETLSNSFRKYGLLAMPVVDHENRLVGIVTFDDVMEVLEEEATEDFEIMAAMSPSDEPYLKTSVLTMTKNRIVWLLLLMLSATVTGTIISGFEDALAILPLLVAFIPMLMNTGGNAGSQSSTLIIRGMALNEITVKDIGAVLWKELRVAVLCGGVLSSVNFLRILIMNRDITIAFSVSASLYATVILAKSVGCLLPMGAKKLNFDPAVMSAPVITTVVDASSLLIYFSLARLILHI